jgi:cell wall-associated NlpC family hydrolase
MANSAREQFVQEALKWVGKQYCSPQQEDCVDCSGLVQRAYAAVANYSISPDSHMQYNIVKRINRFTRGDLGFFRTTGEIRHGNPASHVLIGLGGNKAVSAQNERDGIVITDISTPYWQERLLGFGTLSFADDGTTPVDPLAEREERRKACRQRCNDLQ